MAAGLAQHGFGNSLWRGCDFFGKRCCREDQVEIRRSAILSSWPGYIQRSVLAYDRERRSSRLAEVVLPRLSETSVRNAFAKEDPDPAPVRT